MIALIALLMASPTAAADASPVCRDGKTADQAVSAVYDLVSVPPGGAWDWDRIGDLFMGDGLFVTVMPRPAGSQTAKATLASLREQTEAAYRRSGFIEREYRRQSRVFGNIGVDLQQLLHRDPAARYAPSCERSASLSARAGGRLLAHRQQHLADGRRRMATPNRVCPYGRI